MSVQTPGPAAELIDHAAGIIVEARKQPHTAPGHWAGALWKAGMLVAPGSAALSMPTQQQIAEAALGGIRYNLPVDAFGQAQRLDDYAAIWANAAAIKVLALLTGDES